jgi:replicative DNA helicase
VGELVPAAVERIEKQFKSHSGITGLATGFDELDKILSGLQPSDMVVLAARPSVGKTALALNIAAHAGIRENKGVMIFSLEMAQEQLTQRLLCMEGRIDSRKLREGFMPGQEISKLPAAASRVYPAPIFIDDTANITMLEIRSKARRHLAQHDVQLIIIDYLQLMMGTRRAENRQVEISDISRGIKGLARELRIPVMALSQLSREAEKDDSGVPKLSHLRESGSIEQDADVVLMLWRPPAHTRTQGRNDQPADDNLIKLSIAKQRNGPTGIIDLLFLKNIQRFENVAKDSRPFVQSADEDMGDEDETPF